MGAHRDPWLDAADSIDDREFTALLDAAHDQLADLVTDSGVAFDVSTLLVSGSTG